MLNYKRAVAAFLILITARAFGNPTEWVAQTGDWFEETNWSDGVPDSSRDANIGNGASAQILDGMGNANAVSVGADSVPVETNTGELVVVGPGSLKVENNLSLGTFLGVGTLMISNGGQVSSATGLINESIQGAGYPGVAIVDGAGSSWTTTLDLIVGGELTIQNGGAVTSGSASIDGVAVIDGAGSSWTTGSILVDVGGGGVLKIQNGGLLVSDDIARIGDYPGCSVLVDGPGSKWDNDFDGVWINVVYNSKLSITNGGVVSTFALGVGGFDTQLTVDGSNSALNSRTSFYVGAADFGNGPVQNGAALAQISNGGVINSAATTIFEQGTLIADGVLNTGQVDIDPGGSLSGDGTINGDITSAGHVEPGESIGTLHIEGTFTQSSPGILKAEINGADSDSHDFLSITGDALFDGTLEVRFVNGFLPKAGQVFDLIGVSGTLSGDFAQVTFPDLRSGFEFSGKFVNGVYQLTALNDGTPAIGLRNISTRGQVAPGDNALIAGFIVTGSEEKQVIIRGLGPSIANNGIPVPGSLADPTLELHDSTGTIISSNDDWMDSSDRQAIIDSTIPPGDSNESAIVATLAPGNYTAVLRGVGDSSGVGIVEVYDLSPEVDATLANISTRGFVGAADSVMIGGFIADDQNTSVLLRALGPSLAYNGVTNVLADPTLELHNPDGDMIAFNNDWQDTDEASIQHTGIPPQVSAESAIVATLAPGNFTAIVQGQKGETGIGLLEIYNLK